MCGVLSQKGLLDCSAMVITMKSYEWNALKVGINLNTPRVCKVCGKVKPVSIFAVNGAGYYESICRECKAEREKARYQKYKGSDDDRYWGRRLAAIQQNAERRGISCKLTIQDLKDCYARQRGLCWYTGEPLRIGSVDRIDTERGYSPNNIIMCERYVNVFRGEMPRDEFIGLCRRIAGHHT